MASNLKRFKTGLRPFVEERRLPMPFRGRGWRATLRTYKRDDVNRELVKFARKGRLPVKSVLGEEVIISACCRESAQRALELIVSSLYLIQGHEPIFGSEVKLYAFDDDYLAQLDAMDRRAVESAGLQTVGVLLACAVAAKASHRVKYVYAITKYNFSVCLYTPSYADLHPAEYPPHLSLSKFPSDHIRLCHCIISAYSAIEELGLQVIASQDKPSMLGNKWNPEVRRDLERRLSAAGVDIHEGVLWTRRGSPRSTERRRHPQVVKALEWTRGPIRDCEVDLLDAIAYVGWLRSKVASHKVRELTKSLSPYDVANAHHVVRRLILESLGFWRWHKKEGEGERT